MNTWLYDNFGTIVITLLLALVVTFIIRNMILDRKKGKRTCGGNCASCGKPCSMYGPDRRKP